MADLEPIRMNEAQIRHLEDVRELWGKYHFLASLQEKFRGAMGWKKVYEAEYLTTYWTDPVTGKKHMGSLGRRSPETEKKKADFDAGRAQVDKAFGELKERLAPIIRVGRALRIGRLEPIAADVLRELSREELLGPKLMVIGSAAMHLYEAAAGAFLPRSIMAEGDLDLLTSAESRREIADDLLPVIRRADKSFELQDRLAVARSAGGFRVHFHTRRSLGRSIDHLEDATDEQIAVLHSLLDLKPVKAATIARDGTPIGMVGMDARAFALTKFAMATMASEREGPARIARDQAYATGRLVVKFGLHPFEEEHLAAFPAFAEQIETGDPEVTESVGRVLRF
jgi:hypothetical protein